MNQNIVKIKAIHHINHDVLQIVTEKPPKYLFTPGQATEVSINKTGWKVKKRPFTFTCLPQDDYLEFTFKNIYLCGPSPMMEAVENQLVNLYVNEKIIVKEVF